MTINVDHANPTPDVNCCPCCGKSDLAMSRTQPPVWICPCGARWVMQSRKIQ